MDPAANLREQLEIAAEIFDHEDEGEGVPPDYDAFRLAELVTSLDEWLMKGGFLPALWEANRPKS